MRGPITLEPSDILGIEDHGDAFSWAYALYYWLSHNYEGMMCPKYAAMCAIKQDNGMRNIPSINMDELDDEDDENYQAKLNYHVLTEDNWEEYNSGFKYYMDNKWDDDEC